MDPELRKDNLDFGYVLCSTLDEYLENVPNASQRVRVINKGKRSYRVVFNRVSTGSRKCGLNTIRAHISVNPKFLLLDPLSESEITIQTFACEETSIINSFRVQITELSDATHVQTSRFTVKATFVYPTIYWCRRHVTINYYKTHKFLDYQQWGLCSLFLCYLLLYKQRFNIKRKYNYNCSDCSNV